MRPKAAAAPAARSPVPYSAAMTAIVAAAAELELVETAVAGVAPSEVGVGVAEADEEVDAGAV